MSKEPTAPLSAADARTQLLIERLGRGKQHYRDFTWPGGKLPCRLRMLSNSELQLATAGAVKRWAELDVELSALLANDFADEVVTQRLWLGLEDPERPIDSDRFGRCMRLFDTVDEFRDLTTSAERAAVFDAYVDLEEETDPTPAAFDEATRKRIEEAVKKKDETVLRGFGSSTLRLYLLTTASPPES